MPGGDGTGPMGVGPNGWGRGPCGGGRRGGFGAGGGRGGFRAGFGRGGGWGRGFGPYGMPPSLYRDDAAASVDERELLERRREILERELREISSRLDESREGE